MAARWFYEMADGSLTIGYPRFGMIAERHLQRRSSVVALVVGNEAFPPVAKESALICQTAGTGFTGQHR
jgi:hypothetical protein